MTNKNDKTSQDQHTKGIHELYAEDPIKADKLLWNRDTDKASRRGFSRVVVYWQWLLPLAPLFLFQKICLVG